ncbi:MAG TPA: GNAT family protein [Actinomycetota bacterium]|nr:GNAT family protein [Actinomycetota bacterium]
MKMTAEDVMLRPLTLSDTDALFELRRNDRTYLEPWEPRRSESFWTFDAQQALIEADRRAAAEDRAYALGVFLPDEERLVGRVALSNIVRASWQNATLGYFIGQHFTGRGLATQAVRLVLQVAFENLSLHRVQAAAMPRNSASIRVLEKAGFVHEGMARRYLEINGIWEDHLLYGVTVEEWRR